MHIGGESLQYLSQYAYLTPECDLYGELQSLEIGCQPNQLHKQDKPLIEFKGHEGWVHGVSFSHDEQYLATCSWDGTARLWDLQGNQLEVFKGHTSWVWGINFSPEGQYLATCSGDNTVCLWKLQDDWPTEFKAQFKAHQSFVLDISFSPHEQIFATSSTDGTVRLW